MPASCRVRVCVPVPLPKKRAFSHTRFFRATEADGYETPLTASNLASVSGLVSGSVDLSGRRPAFAMPLDDELVATPLRPWLESVLPTALLEHTATTLEAEDVVSVELLEVAWDEVKSRLRGAPRALIGNALARGEQKPRVSETSGGGLSEPSSPMKRRASVPALQRGPLEMYALNTIRAKFEPEEQPPSLFMRNGTLAPPAGGQHYSVVAFEWAASDGYAYEEHEVGWRVFIDFVMSNAKRDSATSTQSKLPVMAARDVRKLDPEQHRTSSLVQPLLVLRRGSVLCVIPELSIYAVMQNSKLFMLAPVPNASRKAVRAMLEQMACWEKAHSEQVDLEPLRCSMCDGFLRVARRHRAAVTPCCYLPLRPTVTSSRQVDIELPFEYRALEALLTYICGCLSNKTRYATSHQSITAP